MKLSYDIITTPLISNNTTNIKDLNITYKEKPIYNLYKTTLKIKNIGNCIIEDSDFDPSMPLSLITDGEIIIINESEIQIFTEENNPYKSGKIQFNYIAKKQTISYTIFHTTSSIWFSGTLKDGIIIDNIDEKSKNISIISSIVAVIALLINIFILFINPNL